MFTIIGGDGKEYGPVTTDQIRAWIAAGRANLDTQARVVGTEEWRRLADYAEFSAGAAGAPPVMSGTVPVAVTPISGGPELADRGRRLGARLIDWAIQAVLAIPGLILLGTEVIKLILLASQGQEPDFENLDLPRVILGISVLLGAALILLVVQAWLLSTRGQSLGKMAVGIRVVRFADSGKAGFVHAWLLREFVMSIIAVFLSVIPILGVLLQPAFQLTDICFIFRDDRRCLHDLLAGTKVVKA